VWSLTYNAAFWYFCKRGHPEAEDLGAEAAVHAIEAFFGELPRNLDHSPGWFVVVLHNRCVQAWRDWSHGQRVTAAIEDDPFAHENGQTLVVHERLASGGAEAVAEMRQRARNLLVGVCEHILRLEDEASHLRRDAHLKRHMLQGAAAFYRERLARADRVLGSFDTAEEAQAQIQAADPVRIWEGARLPEDPGELFDHIASRLPVGRNSFDQRAKELRRKQGVTLSAFRGHEGAP